MKVTTQLSFDGTCEAAFRLYEQVLGAKITGLFKYADTPAGKDTPPEWRDKIIHANLTIGDVGLTGGDPLPGRYERPQGFYLRLNPTDAATAERVFAALAEEGTVRMPLQRTFFSPAFGVVVDRFGIPWEVDCRRTGTQHD